ncbi:Fc.00g105710.m01.CDS01 [Cosmosporella sp. VM-42]
MGWVINATPEVNAESQYATIIAICIVLSVFSSAVVLARLYVRFHARRLASDDWMSTVSMIFALLYSALCIAQTRYGLGLPVLLRPKANLTIYTRVNYAGRPIYQLGISFFKIALLISYLQLIRGTDHRVYRIVIWVTIAGVFLAHLGCTLSLIFACSPVSRSWNPLEDGTCLPPGPSFTAYAVLTIISDVVVALLPLPVLWKLEIRLGKKLGLIAIFALGLFTTICSILRYMQIDRIQTGDGNSTMLVLWGTIEFNVGVSMILRVARSRAKCMMKNMVSSLPFLAPIFIRKAREYKSKHSHSDEYNTPSGRSRSHGLRSDHYRLRDLSHGKDAAVFTSRTTKSHSGSEENILQGSNGITKSMTYTVRVDEDAGKPGSCDSAGSREDHAGNRL